MLPCLILSQLPEGGKLCETIFMNTGTVIFVTSILFTSRIRILAKFSSLMNSEVLIYTSVFRAEYVTLNVEVFHLSSSGI